MTGNSARRAGFFQLQSELIDTKVDMAVSKSIDRVIEQLHDLRSEMHRDIHALRNDMDRQFASLGHRVTTVESTLTFIKDTQREISNKFVEYVFRAGWLLLATAALFVVSHFFK